MKVIRGFEEKKESENEVEVSWNNEQSDGASLRCVRALVGTSIKAGTLQLSFAEAFGSHFTCIRFDKNRLRVALLLINFSASTMTQKKSPFVVCLFSLLLLKTEAFRDMKKCCCCCENRYFFFWVAIQLFVITSCR